MSTLSSQLFGRVPYVPPKWLSAECSWLCDSDDRVELGRFPTPYHAWNLNEAFDQQSGARLLH